MGKMFQVKIVSSCKFSMTGQLLDHTQVVRPSPSDALEKGQVSGVAGSLQSPDNNYFHKCLVVLVFALVCRLVQFLGLL